MKRVLIIGAGEKGASLAGRLSGTKEFSIAAVIDCGNDSSRDKHAFQVPVESPDWKKWMDREIDIIFETTGKKALYKKIEKMKQAHVLLFSAAESDALLSGGGEPEQSDERLPLREEVMEQLPIGLIVTDREGGILLVNRQLKNLLEIRGTSESSAELLKEEIGLDEVLRTRKKALNFKSFTLNGKNLLASRFPLFDERKQLIGAAALCREMDEIIDLTKRFASVEKLSNLLDTFMGKSDDGIIVADETGICRYVNEAFSNITGMPKKDMLQKKLPSETRYHQEVVAKRRSYQESIKLQRGEVEALLSAEPLLIDGKIRGSVAVLTKSVEKPIREELKRARCIIRGLEAAYRFEDFIQRSGVMQLAVGQAKVAAKTTIPVLLRGERGTGKRRLAKAIHHESSVKLGKWVSIPCASMPEEEIRTFLFGQEKLPGSSEQKGFLHDVHSGTAFLEDVERLSLQLQEKLVAYLESGPSGKGRKTGRHGAVRLMASSAENLERAVMEKEFNEKLYYFLNRMPVFLPSLKERIEDFEELALEIVFELNRKLNMNVSAIDPAAMRMLQEYSWPGNISELKNLLEQAMIFADRSLQEIRAEHIQSVQSGPAVQEGLDSVPLQEAVERFERQLISEAYKNNGYNKTKTAQALNVSVRNLYYKMEKYRIE